MRKKCVICSAEFESKRAAGKYCGATCRKRASRRVESPQSDAPERVVTADSGVETQSDIGFVLEGTLAELVSAGRQDTAIGRAAVAIARRIDSATFDTGSAYAALVKQHSATLAEALKGAAVAADPLDELRARRELKQNAG